MNIKTYKLLIILGIVGLVLALVVAGLLLTRGDAGNEFFPKASSEKKESAPDFTFKLLDGKDFHLSDYKGKPVLINFFASWCLPCREEMPVLEKIVHEYGPKGVVFLGIAIDDTEAKMKDFVARYSVTFPVGLDKTAAIQKSFGIYGIPTTYFIDKEGVINYSHSGSVTEELLQHELDKLL
ncbi:MAG: TlpA disulfide reductase family protein [Gallionella sp.]|nr:TlpA disulfide reductase family protein [Gallionella sp.]